MPNHLIFSAIDVARVVADAIRATSKQRRPTLEQLIKGGAYNDNLDLNEEIEKSIRKGLAPELHLVKDRGMEQRVFECKESVWFVEHITVASLVREARRVFAAGSFASCA